MPVVKSLKDAERVIQAKCKAILMEDVLPVARTIIQKQIQIDVYDSYTPTIYARRHKLDDDSSIRGKVERGRTLSIMNAARPSRRKLTWYGGAEMETEDDDDDDVDPDRLMQWIEFGLVENIFNNKDYPWMHPRPAFAHAQEKINTSLDIMAAVKKGLEKHFGGAPVT
ncbi:MAG: hypothetical protein LBD92_07275 [Oscillospiraceae bacterium]|jgi:hypothetical protein|nr:hypothetical protein [Oscillospiraceae bacterium]